MNGMYWVTRSGIVVESREPLTEQVLAGGRRNKHKTAWCVRVGAGGAMGTLRLDRLRPATGTEVDEANGARK